MWAAVVLVEPVSQREAGGAVDGCANANSYWGPHSCPFLPHLPHFLPVQVHSRHRPHHPLGP